MANAFWHNPYEQQVESSLHYMYDEPPQGSAADIVGGAAREIAETQAIAHNESLSVGTRMAAQEHIATLQGIIEAEMRREK